MPLAPIVCYYSSAKPQSGYSAAVRGYGEKLAAALGLEACALADLPAVCVPEISIGLEAHDWNSGELRPLHAFKARPYADQHGFGPCMHPLTAAQMAQNRLNIKGRLGLVCIANPHWLAEKAQVWAEQLGAWQRVNALDSLIITNSPRTNPIAWEIFLSDTLKNKISNLIINDIYSNNNRYIAALSTADAICLLGTSRSMAGEAAMSRAPIMLTCDNQDDENHFFAAIQQDFLLLRARFLPFDAENRLEEACYEPFDVTQVYVNAALAQIRAEKAA